MLLTKGTPADLQSLGLWRRGVLQKAELSQRARDGLQELRPDERLVLYVRFDQFAHQLPVDGFDLIQQAVTAHFVEAIDELEHVILAAGGKGAAGRFEAMSRAVRQGWAGFRWWSVGVKNL